MDVVASFPVDPQAAEAVQPGDRPTTYRKVPSPVPCGRPRSAITGRMPRCRSRREGRNARRARASERVQDCPAPGDDAHQLPHDLDRLLGDVLSVGAAWLAAREVARQVDGLVAGEDWASAAPDNELAVLLGPSGLRAGGRFVPDGDAAPRVPGGLEGVGGDGELAPVGEDERCAARLREAVAGGKMRASQAR